MPIIQGKQQQRAMPIKHAKTTQKMAKKTSNARKMTATLYEFQGKKMIIFFFNISKIGIIHHAINQFSEEKKVPSKKKEEKKSNLINLILLKNFLCALQLEMLLEKRPLI